MKKFLLAFLVSLLGTSFVTADQFNELEQRVSYLEEKLVENDLLTETFNYSSTYYTFEFVVVDGVAIEMTICALFDGECETTQPTEEQPRLYINSDREAIISDIQSYLNMLDRLYETLN